jgi:sporulation protein YlmC with PRC-barrel domain
MQNVKVMRASEAIGETVINAQGEDLGEIADIVLDAESGQIRYVVLSFGGFLGMGDKLFAIPWNSFKYVPGEKLYVLDMDRERLENAPGFDPAHWPDMEDPNWGQEVHEFYGHRPFWQI